MTVNAGEVFRVCILRSDLDANQLCLDANQLCLDANQLCLDVELDMDSSILHDGRCKY